MFLQQRQKFLLKRHLLVMFLLAFDITNDVVQLRHAHTECAILFLPRKQAMFGKGFVDPFGRTALDQLHRLGDGDRGRQGKQEMDVVFDSADFNGLHFVAAHDTAQEWPEPFGKRRRDEPATLLGAEDAMVVGTDVGHATIQPSLRDLGKLTFVPALKRRAILTLSLRDRERAKFLKGMKIRSCSRDTRSRHNSRRMSLPRLYELPGL